MQGSSMQRGFFAGHWEEVLHLGTIKSRSLVFAGLNMQFVYIHFYIFLPETKTRKEKNDWRNFMVSRVIDVIL
jgi:hypothetical protein